MSGTSTSPSITKNGSSPVCGGTAQHGVTEPARALLANVEDLGELGDRAYLPQLVDRAGALEQILELERAVEVVLDRALASAGDDEYVVDAGGDRLFDHVLDDRLVHDRQHLFRLRLGGGQEPRAETRGRNDGLHLGDDLPGCEQRVERRRALLC